MRPIHISIVIVNWHSAKYLRPCLKSIYERVTEIDFEVIVIDNASFDGSADLVRHQFPRATFIQGERNLGFARANNIAAKQSLGQALLFLNPDTEIIDSSIGAMFEHLMRRSTVGAIGCRLLNTDLTIQRHYLQAFPTLLNQLLNIDLLKRTFPRWELWGMRALYDYKGEPLDVEAIAGSCVMVRRSAFEHVGGFTDSYFMYGEDIDLSYKLHSAGYRVQYFGEGKVVHHWGKSSELCAQRNLAEIMAKESVALFMKCRRGHSYAKAFRCMTGCAAFLRLCIVFLLACFGGIVFFRRWVFASANKWVRVLYWAARPKEWTHKRPTMV